MVNIRTVWDTCPVKNKDKYERMYVETIKARIANITKDPKKTDKMSKLLAKIFEEITHVNDDGYPVYADCYWNLLVFKIMLENKNYSVK